MDIGARLLIALVALGDIVLYRKLALKADYFFGAEVELFKFINDHVAKYSALPKPATLAQAFKALPPAPEPVQFYADQVEHRFAHKTLNAALLEATSYMKVGDTFTTQNLMTEALIAVRGMQARTALEEFMGESPEKYMGLYVKKQTEDIPEVYTGWPYLDKHGGLKAGDVLSLVGRPALGKTFSLLYMAHHAAIVQERRVLFVSMEMSLAEIRERLVAMYAHFPMDHIQNYELSTTQQQKLPTLLARTKKEQGRMWVLDGSFASTLDDMFSLVHQLAPHALYIDGAYLIRHTDSRMDRYRRAEVNMELLKRRVAEFGIPALQTYQFNRQAAKKMKLKGEHGGLEDIAFSDSIGQISSVVLGMYEEESVETAISREIHVLKGRKGQVGKYHINWKFDVMDFSQIDDEEKKKKGELKFT